MRTLAAIVLVTWLAFGPFMTLMPAHPRPGQLVNDNVVPFRTIGIYLDNATDPFWIRQAIGNVLFLLPIGLLGPFALPALDRWWRALLLAALFSASVGGAALDPRPHSRCRRRDGQCCGRCSWLPDLPPRTAHRERPLAPATKHACILGWSCRS